MQITQTIKIQVCRYCERTIVASPRDFWYSLPFYMITCDGSPTKYHAPKPSKEDLFDSIYQRMTNED